MAVHIPAFDPEYHIRRESCAPKEFVKLIGARSSLRNRLLRSLSAPDFELLSTQLTTIELTLSQPFEIPGEPIEKICFPETGVISVVARNSEGRSIEAGLIGFEGMSGLAVVLGDDRSPNEAYVQLAGTGHTVSSDSLRAAIAGSPTLLGSLIRYAHNFLVQTSQTALANGRAKINERLARWLLMASDRVGGDSMMLTHEFLSLMLGVRRPGVTDALHRLEGDRLIRARRSQITIRDRAGLLMVAGGSYGVTERDYERVFGALAGADPEASKAA